MNICFRVDSSTLMGSGHVMRCLTLADALRQHGAEVTFVCREHPGNLINLIENKGYPVARLQPSTPEYDAAPDDVAHAAWLCASWLKDSSDTIAAMGETLPEWLIVDHYAIDYRWERKLRPYANRIMVIDDIADRPHDCDLLLDQNLYQNMETRYDNLVPSECKKMLGPTYALIRPEFVYARNKNRQRDGQVRRVLVFFGGVDPTNETEKALIALSGITVRQFEVDVVVGSGNFHKEQIKNFCEAHVEFHYHCQVDNMAELMVAADLAIGGGGATTWERCFLGLPAIVLIVAENQAQTTTTVAKRGAICCLGHCSHVSFEMIAKAIINALTSPNDLKKMGEKALLLMGDITDVSSHLLPEIRSESDRTF